MTEKRKPTHALEAIKTAAERGRLLVTGTANRSAVALGCGRAEVVEIIKSMMPKHFYKSMTSNNDHRQWQDVYHVPSKYGVLYVKFTRDGLAEFVLLSFKEKGDG